MFGAAALSNGQVQVYKNGTLLGVQDASTWPYYASGGCAELWMMNANGTKLDNFGGGTCPASRILTHGEMAFIPGVMKAMWSPVRVSVETAPQAAVIEYEYDGLDRLTAADYSNGV